MSIPAQYVVSEITGYLKGNLTLRQFQRLNIWGSEVAFVIERNCVRMVVCAEDEKVRKDVGW